MIKKLNPIHAAALAFLLAAGCAQPNVLTVQPAGQVATEGATLHLKLELGRRTQVTVGEITSLSVSVEMPGRAPLGRTFAPADWQNDALDFSGLPAGNATIQVVAKGAEGQTLGQGSALAALLIGRRTYAQVTIGLSSEGKSDLLPFGPLKPGTVTGGGETEPTPSPSPTPTDDATQGPAPREYLVPGSGLTSRRYELNETIQDPSGFFQKATAVVDEQISPASESGVHITRTEAWTFEVGDPATFDLTDDFVFNTDGSVSRYLENQTTGEFRSSNFPAGAFTPEGITFGTDGRMWLDRTEPHYAAGQTFDCYVVAEARGPAEQQSVVYYYLAKGFGIVRFEGTVWMPRQDGGFDKRMFSMDLKSYQMLSGNPYAWRVGR